MDTASLVAQLQLNQITSLKISKNEQLVEFGGIEGLLNLLRHNSSVTRLDLSGLYIGDEGAKAVAEALKVNSTLQTIDLVGNSIGDEGAKAVAEALTLNSTLQTIGLGKNIGEDLKAQIAETLREIRARKEMNYRKLICAFTACQVDSACLRFDKMMLRYVYYPILGASEKSFED
jgi:Ran GTPase-activating protein (RanGAP) involved in mRNA processing and transport